MTISVIPVSVTPMVVTARLSTQTIPFGMGMDVAQAIHVALCQICAPTVHSGLKHLSSSTTDNVEMRLCKPKFNYDGSTPIEVVELYVE
jgi:hypothetical protein